MEDIKFDQGSFQLLMDPVYGPNSKYFWPGSRWDASSYVSNPTHSPVYVSGEEFLEMYEDEFSGVEAYVESTDYLDQSYCDTLYHHFYKLYNHVESWERTTLFVSAVYRDIFHEMFPYESQILEFKTDLDYVTYYVRYVELYLKEGKSEEEAMRAAYGRAFEEIEKGERKLSLDTCRDLISLILSSRTDLSLISELIKVLHRTNIVATHQKELQEGLLLELEAPYPIFSVLRNETRRDLCREKLVLVLSLFEIEPKVANEAVDDTLSSRSHEPIIRLIRDHPFDGQGWPTNPSKSGFVNDEVSAYYLAPQYTATDYIRELVLSEQAYNRIFEEVRDSAAELEITSVLMSFEEEAGKLGQLACLDMLRELYTDQEDTPLLSIIDSAAKSFDEGDLITSDEVSVKKIFDKIREKITVPPKARKRILEICKKHGIPDNEALAEKIISEASSTNTFSQEKGDSAREQLVTAFVSLLVLALLLLLPGRSNAMVLGPKYENQIGVTRLYVRDEPSLGLTGRFRPEPTNGGRGLSGVASQSLVQFNRPLPSQEILKTERQTKRIGRQSIVASTQKKGFDSQNPTFLTTKRDKKKFDDIYIHGTFDHTTKEITMEGSCGPAHRLEQLRKGPVAKVAKKLGYKALEVDLDHHLSSRVRQGLTHHTVRKYDLSIVEAISPPIHKLITARGPQTYELPKGIVSIDNYLDQILTNRIKVFESPEAQAIMGEEGRFKPKDYTAWSQRGSTWNRKFLRYIAAQQGVDYNCVKSLLYPKQIYDDANVYIKRMRAHLSLTAARDLIETQARLTETIEQVSNRVSLLANFRASSQGLPGLGENIKRLVFECNQLCDLANSQYSNSRFTGSPLKLPPRGRIVTLDQTIAEADKPGYNYRKQWFLHGAEPESSDSSLESLKKCTKLILSTNGIIVDQSMKTSMSQSMKNFMIAPLAGESYNELDDVYR